MTQETSPDPSIPTSPIDRAIDEDYVKFLAEFASDRKSGSINRDVFKDALIAGATLSDAARAAGSLAKQPAGVGSAILAKDPELRNEVLDALKEKRQMLIDSMTQEKADKSSMKDIAISLDIITKHVNQIEGRSTEESATHNTLIIIQNNIQKLLSHDDDEIGETENFRQRSLQE